MQYRKKPVVIEAFQFSRRNNGQVAQPDWFHDAVTRNEVILRNTGKWSDVTLPAYCEIKTLEGVMRADDGDWIILGVKGEIYPCKPDIFAATYTAVSNEVKAVAGMSFSNALVALKSGDRVARAGWNGQGMWVCLGNGAQHLPADQFWNGHTRAFAESNGGSATVQPYLIMKNAQGYIQMGWAPTQSDLLSDDWYLVDDEIAEAVQKKQDAAAYQAILQGDTSGLPG